MAHDNDLLITHLKSRIAQIARLRDEAIRRAAFPYEAALAELDDLLTMFGTPAPSSRPVESGAVGQSHTEPAQESK